MTGEQLDRWAPLSIPELTHILAPARFPWWVAGGQALDLFLGTTTRHHEDLDVEILRRNPAIVQPLEAIGRRTEQGVPYLAPTIQLLFKAKDPRPKDIADFNAVLAALPGADRTWLANALTLTYPNHPWLALLRDE